MKTISAIFLVAMAALTQSLADDGPVRPSPAPRQRVQTEADEVELNTVNGKSVVGRTQTTEARFIRTITHAIQAKCDQARKDANDDAPMGIKFSIDLRIDSQSGRIEVVDIIGELDVKTKAIIRRSAEECSGLVAVPDEIKQTHGRSIGTVINFVIMPESDRE